MRHFCGRIHPRHAPRTTTSTDGRGALNSTNVLDGEARIVPARVMEAVDEMSAPTHDEIARLAYSYWEARGGQGGSPWDDWFRAEQELKRRQEL